MKKTTELRLELEKEGRGYNDVNTLEGRVQLKQPFLQTSSEFRGVSVNIYQKYFLHTQI